MKSFSVKKGVEATIADRKLLNKVHPISARIMRLVRKPSVVKIPGVGAIVNDAELIRKVFLDKTSFSKIGEGVSSALWTPIIGPYGLLNMEGESHIRMRRELASSFSQKVIPMLVENVFTNHIKGDIEKLATGETIDVVEVTSELAYRTLWELLGFTGNETSADFKEITTVLRSVTEGVTLHRKKLPEKQIIQARQKLIFVEKLTVDSYNSLSPSGVIGVMKTAGYSVEEVVSVVKSLMITGTETVISYIPRMVALFIRSGFMGDVQKNVDLLNTGLDEAFRITVPTPVAARAVINDTIVGGKKLKPGERAVLATVSACQKGGDFNPYVEMDKNIKGLWFGAGTHMCIGLPMAKAQSSQFIKTLINVADGKEIILKEAVTGTKGHTGSYSKLIVGLKG